MQRWRYMGFAVVALSALVMPGRLSAQDAKQKGAAPAAETKKAAAPATEAQKGAAPAAEAKNAAAPAAPRAGAGRLP